VTSQPVSDRRSTAGVFVAHNARFDWRFLAAECAAIGVPRPAASPCAPFRLTPPLVPELRHVGSTTCRRSSASTTGTPSRFGDLSHRSHLRR